MRMLGHRIVTLLFAPYVCLAQQGKYDLTCWMAVEIGYYACRPCWEGQVEGNTCTTWNLPCTFTTQEECCVGHTGPTDICMDNWDECRGATSFDPTHEITNSQCLDWCRAKDAQFDANCAFESYDYSKGSVITDIDLWPTNVCISAYAYQGESCVGAWFDFNATAPGQWGCQDACASNEKCCFWSFLPGEDCNLFSGGSQQDCMDVVINPDGTTTPTTDDSTLCEPEFLQSCIQGTLDCLVCDGQMRCLDVETNNQVYGPPICYPGFDQCHPGNNDTCHYGGANPVVTGSTLEPPQSSSSSAVSSSTSESSSSESPTSSEPDC